MHRLAVRACRLGSARFPASATSSSAAAAAFFTRFPANANITTIATAPTAASARLAVPAARFFSASTSSPPAMASARHMFTTVVQVRREGREEKGEKGEKGENPPCSTSCTVCTVCNTKLFGPHGSTIY